MPINGDWSNVVNIPEGKIVTGRDEHGETAVEIKHIERHAGWTEPTSSMRTRLFGGHDDETIKFPEPTRWHELSYEGGVLLRPDEFDELYEELPESVQRLWKQPQEVE